MAGVHTYFSTKILPILILALFIGEGVLIDLVVKWFKKNVTLRRTGSMVLRKLNPLTRSSLGAIWIGIPALTVILMAFLLVFRQQLQSTNQDAANVLLPVFWGLLFGVMWFAAARRVGLNHFYLMAAVSFGVKRNALYHRDLRHTGHDDPVRSGRSSPVHFRHGPDAAFYSQYRPAEPDHS